MATKTKLDNNLIHQHIISALNLEYLPDDQKAMLLDKMTEVINQKVLLRLLKDVNADKRAELEEILDKGTDEDLQNFITLYVPNFLTVLAEEIVSLKNGMVNHLGLK